MYVYTYVCCAFVPAMGMDEIVDTYVHMLHTYIHNIYISGSRSCLISPYIRTYTRTYIHTNTNKHTHTYIHACIHTYIRKANSNGKISNWLLSSTHTYIHTCMHACIYSIHTHTYIIFTFHVAGVQVFGPRSEANSKGRAALAAFKHTYIHACMHTYIHIYIHISGSRSASIWATAGGKQQGQSCVGCI
jgi:hypothetical protein